MNRELFETLSNTLNKKGDELTKFQEDIIPLKALSPENGGDGELDKAKYYEKVFGPLVDELKYYNAPDERVSCGFRPNICAIKKGKSSEKRFMIVGHIDVVPEGDIKAWKTDPWKAVVKDGKIYGRGSEDNNQAVASAYGLLKSFYDEKITPPYDIVLLLCADEECGNKYGIKYLVENHKELFKKGDCAIAPDSGRPAGDEMSIGEKGCIWLKVITEGKQAHAAYPDKGINAHYAGAEFITQIEKLQEEFPEENPIYNPPKTTFQVSKKEANVPNINSIPGRDVVYFDCRFLPLHSQDKFVNRINEIKADVEKRRGVKITFEFPYVNIPTETVKESGIVQKSIAAVKEIYNVDPKLVGTGGGTIASFIRQAGGDAVVYSKLDDTLHEPNEYCLIENMVGDAKVMAYVLCDM